MRKVMYLCIFLAIAMWCIRIGRINRNQPEICEISMNESFETGELKVTPEESGLYSLEEFAKRFDLEPEELEQGMETENEQRILCVRFEVCNETDEDISWDEVLNGNGIRGFESVTWVSMDSSFLERNMNVFTEDCLKAHSSQKVWFATQVNAVCFKRKTWEHLQEETFRYVWSLTPKKITIRLEV